MKDKTLRYAVGAAVLLVGLGMLLEVIPDRPSEMPLPGVNTLCLVLTCLVVGAAVVVARVQQRRSTVDE